MGKVSPNLQNHASLFVAVKRAQEKRAETGGWDRAELGRSVPACRRWAAPLRLLGFRAVQVFLIKGFVFVVERRGLALDEKVAHLCGELEGVAVLDDDVGAFAALARA